MADEQTVNQILDYLNSKRTELQKEAKNIYIINAGRMNHGKSSLMNGLLGRNAFKVADIRQTVRNQAEKYKNNVFFVDTPGLDSNQQDDTEAYAVYEKANFILYVHNPKIGEIHKQEIEHIKRIRKLLGDQFLRKHFALVLTFCEEFSEDQLNEIIKHIQKSLTEECALPAVPVFQVSNSRFQKSAEQDDPKKKKIFLQKSGLPVLTRYIEEHISEWKAENQVVQEKRFENIKQSSIDLLNKQKTVYLTRIQSSEKEFSRKEKQLEYSFEQAIRRIQNYEEDWRKETTRVSFLQSQVNQLKEKHRREK
ncbi:GTPase [Acidaminococcus fermentans]|uniref:GTPase n=1 Tax=Acidaminococcus fermentans TaxID=905 RepID=UPI00242BD97A|nr:GTPase [Acidaminococcus fermentans]